jgi:TetR/AcrR family transcriptional regulator, repressor for uid operon
VQQAKAEPGEVSTPDRKAQILDAAERSFCRAGFHRTTMQDVAAEAQMSPGNLYRYFPSKDALVAGLCERDRVNLSREFGNRGSDRSDFLAAFKALGRKHFERERQNKARLCLEIWAEASRNPAIAALQTDFDNNLMEHLVSAFERAKAEGFVPQRVNSLAVASIVSKLGDGLFVRCATAKDFDIERELDEVFAIIGALLSGAIELPRRSSSEGERS